MAQISTTDLLKNADSLKERDQLLDAALLYKQVVEQEPKNTEALYKWACIAYARGNIQNAEILLKQLLAIDPANVSALTKLGDIYADSKRPFLARQFFEKALESDDTHIAALNSLAIVLSEQIDDPYQAEKVARQGLAINDNYGLLRQVLAKTLYMQGRSSESIEYYKEDIKRSPESRVDNLCNIGAVYTDSGEKNKAVECYEEVIRINPLNVEAHCSLATIKKFKLNDPHIEILKALLTKTQPHSDDAARVAFSLAKSYDDIKDYEQAFTYIDQGNKIVHSAFSYNPEATQKLFVNTKVVFEKNLKNKKFPTEKSETTPIFIIGMPRSGSTLVEQILYAHPRVDAAGETSYLRQTQLAHNMTDISSSLLTTIRNEYLEKLARHAVDSKFIVDKTLDNYFYLGLIKTLFPRAKVIHCRRDPMANCFSIYKLLFKDTIGYAYNMDDLGQYYKSYEGLMTFWQQKLPDFIHEIQYEDLIMNQKYVTRKMLEFCELPWDASCLDFHKRKRTVLTASNLQVTKPIYTGSLESWRNYEPHLGSLKKALSSEA